MFRKQRLVEQTRLILADGRWITITALAEMLDCSECGASARLRDLRKAKFGGHRIVKRRCGRNFYQYRLVNDRHIKQARRNADEQ